MALRGPRMTLLALAALLLVPSLALRAEEKKEGKEKKKEETTQGAKDPAMPETWPEPEPPRRGTLTYRERKNLITRKPMRAEGPPRQPRTSAEREYPGLRDSRPVIARKVDWFAYQHSPRAIHVDRMGRTMIQGPIKPEDEGHFN